MRKIVFVLLFSLLSVLAVLYFEYKKDNFVVEHLHSRTEQLNLLYDSLYSEYKKVSNMIYDTQINRDDVIAIFKQTKRADDKEKSLLREELYNHLKEKYLLYKKYGVKQLHFHLSDNSSFLRFHRPKMFGDDLSRFRPTIAYVNRYKKAIDGYEEGKIFSGYRFVYPLFDETIGYIGSVEVSFGMLSMTKEIIEHFNIPANFLIAKSVVDAKVVNGEKSNYVSSSFSDYYFEKDILANFKKEFSMQERKLISEASKATFYANIGKGDTFSIFDEKSSNIITFIPVQNPINKIIIGAISVRGDARYIEERISEFYQLATIAIIVIFLVLHIIYRELFYRDEMIKRNKNLSDKVKEEVKKNIKKEKTMLHQSRLAQMGEMLSMIAHQWRQPLSAISATSADLGMKTMLNKYEKNIFREKLGNIAEYSQHLSKTIDDFRDFYKSNKEKRSVLLGDVFLGALSIVESSMVNKNINIPFYTTTH
ncbi:MAG: cache domain-containing protein [Campylobacterota bacterium]|nr:cache domain-containing protein [Campylobacterota bacterium]